MFVVDQWVKKLESYRGWFKEQESIKADESLRPGKPKTHDDLFGLQGSFRQLAIDWTVAACITRPSYKTSNISRKVAIINKEKQQTEQKKWRKLHYRFIQNYILGLCNIWEGNVREIHMRSGVYTVMNIRFGLLGYNTVAFNCEAVRCHNPHDHK